ncbi:hypothetical protein JTE90_019536 [Oedothorax gibbosus]|uniref:Scavenger receptor class B member 1 n=1 Tax=Oedothorax gibbosus TaxID=931172 RepID=A0AAV6U7Q0_9ARAC|nr:hypothetical protein JTE90_019536 [Oedothorax gibbosus]
MAAKCMSKTSAKILLTLGVFLLVISVAVLLIFPTIYKNQLKNDIALSDGSLVTKIWKDIPLPLYEKLYFFNITNGDEFLKGAKLNVTEVGPYTFKGHWVKNYTKWNDNGTVSYTELRTYEFVPGMSVGSQEDEIFSLNGPMVIASDILKGYPIGIRALAAFEFAMMGETVITKRSIRELAYEGYPDKIIKWAPKFKKDIPYKDGLFSWLYGKNNTNDGLFTVFTGVDDPTQTNIIDKYNGEEKLSFWKGDTCNMLNGTSIETGPPIPEEPETYTFFQTIFCRSLTFNFTGDSEIKGVKTKHFEPDSNIFANGSDNPANSCFDLKGERPSGVLDVSPCQFDAPVFISFPHFHMADPVYENDINGLSPNGGDHGSYVEVEPITGLSVNIKVRFQINLNVTHTDGVFQLGKVIEGLYPILWVGLEISLDDYWANYLTGQLNNPKIISYSVLGVTLFLSLVMIIVALIVLRSHARNDDDDPLLDVKEDHRQNLKKRHVSTDYGSNTVSQQRERSSVHIEQGITNHGLDVDDTRYESFDENDDDAPVLSVNSREA